VEVDAAVQMMLRGGEAAAIEHGHRDRAMRLDQIAGLLCRLRPLVQALALGGLPQIHAEIVRAGEIRDAERADPEAARGGKGLFVVVELLAELERADVIL